MKYKIITYGCQMNVHDSEKIAGMLSDLGYTQTEETEEADVIVFNTCCVRETAEQKAIGNIGSLKKLKKRKPNVIIAVCGCMSQASGNSEKLSTMFPFIDIICGTHNIHYFKNYLQERLLTGKRVIQIWSEENKAIDDVNILNSHKYTAFVNIIYGCDNFCTYCIVPYVRGRERSRPFEDVYNEVQHLINLGYKEIMLLGQNVNSYGKDIGGMKFYELLDKIAKIEGKYRIRFMTSNPKDFDENLIKVIRDNNKICNNIHLPVQSGSDNVLKQMNRKYTRSQYLNKIDKIHKLLPDCGITSDIMIGFPGETEQDYKDTLDLVEKVRYNGCFMFVYSKRNGTYAAKMQNQVSDEIKKQRIIELNLLQNNITREINKEKYLNKTFEVLTEGIIENKENIYCGKTDCGRLVSFYSDKNCLGEFLNIKITKAATSSLFGEIVYNK